MGEPEAAMECYELALSGQNKTPWTAWLYGRTLHYVGETAEAKDALLLACHNGQDFARACWDLAEIYEELELDAVLRRTQSEAKRHYLRTSPKGWRAEQLRRAP
jgi:predicted Zn-dependent protease